MNKLKLTKHCQREVEFAEKIQRFDKHYFEHKLVLDIMEENQQLKNQLYNISNEFLKYDWKTSNKEQIVNQLESLYNSIFRSDK